MPPAIAELITGFGILVCFPDVGRKGYSFCDENQIPTRILWIQHTGIEVRCRRLWHLECHAQKISVNFLMTTAAVEWSGWISIVVHHYLIGANICSYVLPWTFWQRRSTEEFISLGLSEIAMGTHGKVNRKEWWMLSVVSCPPTAVFGRILKKNPVLWKTWHPPPWSYVIPIR